MAELATEGRGPLWAVVRGVVFLPGIVLTLSLTYVLAHTGLHEVLVYMNLLLVPVAIVCYIKASIAGDRWTVGYLVALVVDYLVVGLVLSMTR